MPITKTAEDLLPNIGQPIAGYSTASDALAAMAVHSVDHAAAAGIERDISGCIALIGPVQLCYDVNISTPSVAVSLKVGPVTVISGEISPAHPCLTFKGDYGLAKWDINLCLRGSSVTLEGNACVTWVGCKTFNVTIIHW